jgi:hypothetical protein
MTFTFSSANDIDKALRRDGYDPSGLKELKPALDQLAKRRQRIVHHGDLLDRAPDVDSWRFADFWQLMHWNLNVVGALYVLLPAVTEQNELYTRRYHFIRQAIGQHVEYGNAVIKISEIIKSGDYEAVGHALTGLQEKLAAISKLLDEMYELPRE